MTGRFRLASAFKQAALILLCLVMILPLFCFRISAADIWSGNAAKGFSGGKGTPESPYLIKNAEQLALFAGLVNGTIKTLGGKNVYRNQYNSACYALTADIYLNDLSNLQNWSKTKPKNSWTPIGYYTSSDAYAPFCGSFDGRGHSVYGVYIKSDKNRQGLFGCIEGGTVFDLSVKSSYIEGSMYVGGIVGYASGSASAVNGCFSDAIVSGSMYVGGIAGASGGMTSLCKNTGSVSGKTEVGGIVGGAEAFSMISNCINTGAVNGSSDIGGIFGGDKAFSRAVCSVNTGKITGSSNSGAVAGKADGSIFYGCYYLSGSSSKGIGSSSSESSSTVKLTATEMKQEKSFPLLNFSSHFTMSASSPEITRLLLTGNGTSAWNGEVAQSFSSGSGTKADPYKITKASELAFLSKLVNSGNSQSGKYFVITADITFNSFAASGFFGGAVGFDPIGNEKNPFCGSIDGKGHTISGLYITGTGKGTGLFGCSKGTVTGIKVKDSVISGGKYVGALVGINFGTVSSCSAKAEVFGSQFVGGLVGKSESSSKITSSGTSGTVFGSSAVGGITGGADNAAVESCTSNSTVQGGDSVGGIAGYAETSSKLNKLKNNGNVYGADNVGGIGGQLYYYSKITLSQNNGKICGRSSIGGIIGYASWRSSALNCLNCGAVSASSDAGGIAGYIYNNSTVEKSVSRGKISSVTPSGIVGKSSYSSVLNCYYLQGSAKGGISGKDEKGKAVSVKSGARKTDYPGLDFALYWVFVNGKPELQVFTDIIALSSSDISSSKYKIDISAGIISRIPAGTALSQFKSNLKTSRDITVTDANGKAITDKNALIPTGAVLTLSDRIGALTLSVIGDVNGDGKATITDFIQIKSHLLSGGKTLNGIVLTSADVNLDSKVSITDFVKFKAYLLGNGGLSA